MAPEVVPVFESCDADVRRRLLLLRQLILDTANETDVGTLEETLKWGQPGYLTAQTRSGSTIRIAPTNPGSKHNYAMYFIWGTNLVEAFQDLFGDVFTYDGNRALLFTIGDEVPENELRECVARPSPTTDPRANRFVWDEV